MKITRSSKTNVVKVEELVLLAMMTKLATPTTIMAKLLLSTPVAEALRRDTTNKNDQAPTTDSSDLCQRTWLKTHLGERDVLVL